MSLDHIGLVVGNLPMMTEWWSEALPARIDYTIERSSPPMRAVVLVDPSGFRLELLHRPGSAPRHGGWSVDQSLLTHGFAHLALAVEDVARSYERLVALGAAPVMQPRAGSRPGLTIAFVGDPESNLIELVRRGARTT